MFEGKENNWEKRIEEYRISGESQKQFCEENGLALSTFRRKLSKKREMVKKEKNIWVEMSMNMTSSKGN